MYYICKHCKHKIVCKRVHQNVNSGYHWVVEFGGNLSLFYSALFKCLNILLKHVSSSSASQVILVVKNPSAIAGDIWDAGLIPGSGRSPGGGHGNPLKYSCLENPMDRGAWWTTVYGSQRVRHNWSDLALAVSHFTGIPLTKIARSYCQIWLSLLDFYLTFLILHCYFKYHFFFLGLHDTVLGFYTTFFPKTSFK